MVLGLKGWLAPKGWQAGLPPISLLAVLAAMVPLLVKRKLVLARERGMPRKRRGLAEAAPTRIVAQDDQHALAPEEVAAAASALA